MNQGKLKKYKYAAGVGSIIIAFVIYKLRFLALPYFWDEASPYSIAVRTLYDNGPSLVPGAISPDLSRGHPLMFHFLAAGWMKIFGTSLVSGHSFILFISVLLIVTIYLFCKNFFSERIGFVACLLFSCQPVFIAQSVFLLPEVLLALWVMLSALTFFTDRKALFVFFATAMLLTKETGSVFLIALFVFEFFVFVRSYEKKPGLFLKRLALVCVPVAIASVSFIIQKIKFGWFFYPLHMGYIVSASMHFTETLLSAAAYVFIYYGRNGLSFFIIVSLILIFFAKRTAFLQKERRIITAVSFFIILQLVFCAVNFYIPRYLLCVFPLFCIVATVVIDKAFSNFKLIYPLIVTGLMITGIFFYTRPKASGDIDYSPSIITDLQMVRFFEQQHLSDAHIFTTCVLRYDLCEPYAGYLSGEKFRNVQSDFSGDTEYCVFSADENDLALFDKIKRENKLVLVQRFEKKYAWCEIYKVIR